MIDRACISINNRCNLACKYCHFREKEEMINPCKMDVMHILDNIKKYILDYKIPVFKIGFVGNGEALLDYELLQKYILSISDMLKVARIRAYIITNGTILDKEKILFLKENKVNLGVSLDGPKEIHNEYRCDSFDVVMKSIELFKRVNGYYPSLNCTVGREAIEDSQKIISFFKRFETKITFSRMIGKYGITLEEYRAFIDSACKELNIRTGGYDCTMYGGFCGAGINNVYFANKHVYVCGNCIDLKSLPYDTPIDQIDFDIEPFDRRNCYKELITK